MSSADFKSWVEALDWWDSYVAELDDYPDEEAKRVLLHNAVQHVARRCFELGYDFARKTYKKYPHLL